MFLLLAERLAQSKVRGLADLAVLSLKCLGTDIFQREEMPVEWQRVKIGKSSGLFHISAKLFLWCVPILYVSNLA